MSVHNHATEDGPGLACHETLQGQCVRDQEIAHAVALERERIAAWLEGWVAERRLHCIELDRDVIVALFAGTPGEFVNAIRNGAHNQEQA